MKTKREVFRLALVAKLSHRQIAQSLRIDHKTVGKYIGSLPVDLLDYQKIESLPDPELIKALQPDQKPEKRKMKPLPDWEHIHQQLQQKGVTLKLLHEEYKRVYPDGYQSSQFHEYYQRWAKKLNPSMRQTHLAGEKMFVDYAGVTVPIRDRGTGKIRKAQIFVAVLGASSYLYTEATWDQTLPSWIRSHTNAFKFFGGVPKVIIPDNLRSAVSKSCRYDPDLNPAYHKLSVHYGTAIIPARVRKPQDKAKAEQGVQMVERWILAPLRNITFFNLSDLNHRIAKLRTDLNLRKMQQWGDSRQGLFEKIDRPALQPLPGDIYVFEQWKNAKVNIDYHIEVEKHYYSAPFSLIHERVEVRFTDHLVEIFHHNKRVASHKKCNLKGYHSTQKEHMPPSHQEHLKWTPKRLIHWANSIGENTAEMARQIMEHRRYPQQGFRPVLGILRLSNKYGEKRLEKACMRALAFGNFRYKEIVSILEKGLDRQHTNEVEKLPVKIHQNIRGERYYSPTKETSC